MGTSMDMHLRRRWSSPAKLLLAACFASSASGLNVGLRAPASSTCVAPLGKPPALGAPALGAQAATSAASVAQCAAAPPQQAAWSWGDALQSSLLTLMAGSLLMAGGTAAVAENELTPTKIRVRESLSF